jgi:signal transduction histidine kinase
LEETNLIGVVEMAFNVISFQAANKNIKLILSLDAHKPFIYQRVVIDIRRMLQVLLNFISNSLKFTPKNGFIKVHLRILEEQKVQVKKVPGRKKSTSLSFMKPRSFSFNDKIKDNSQVLADQLKYIKFEIEVEDSGVGIAEENIDKLFHDYTRLEEHTEINHKGTGLGLSICKNIIEKMGGCVRVESKINEGSKFKIILNLKAIDRIQKEEQKVSSESFNFNFANEDDKKPFTKSFNTNFKQIKADTGDQEAKKNESQINEYEFMHIKLLLDSKDVEIVDS